MSHQISGWTRYLKVGKILATTWPQKFMNSQYYCKGKTSHKNKCFLSRIARITPPPLSGNLYLFFGRQKRRFPRITLLENTLLENTLLKNTLYAFRFTLYALRKGDQRLEIRKCDQPTDLQTDGHG